MKLIILDRDGVINEDSDEYIKSPEEFVPIPGSVDAIARLCHAGYTVIVATNQSGLARGYFDMEALQKIHEKMNRLLAAAGGRISAIFFCPPGPELRQNVNWNSLSGIFNLAVTVNMACIHG